MPYIDDLDREQEMENARGLKKLKNQRRIYVIIAILITLLILSGGLTILFEFLSN